MKILRKIINVVFKQHFFEKKIPLCRIDKIDFIKNQFTIHCRYIEAPIRLSFDELISDKEILSNFSSKHASWIGYYYGYYYNRLLTKKCDYSIPFYFDKNDDAHYKIEMITRQGCVVYSDRQKDATYNMSPIIIMSDENLIKQFDPIQACYIGILSGISKSKIINRQRLFSSKKIELTLVK